MRETVARCLEDELLFLRRRLAALVVLPRQDERRHEHAVVDLFGGVRLDELFDKVARLIRILGEKSLVIVDIRFQYRLISQQDAEEF